MAKIMPQITTSATSTSDVPTQKFAGVDAADASKIVVVTSDPTSGDTFDYADPSVIAGGRWQDGDAATDVVLETSTDSVGIGTTNPASKLHVETASSHCSITLTRSEQGTGDVGLNMEGGTGGKIWYVIQQAGSDDLTFWDSNGDAARVTYKSGGNVGIGVTDPDTTLEVLDTTTQLKLSYDDSNYVTFAVDSGGDMTVTPSGADSSFVSSTKLVVKNTDDCMLELDAGNGGNSARQFNLRSEGAGGDTRLAIGSIDADGTDALNIMGSTRRVGIGDIDPGTMLQIKGTGESGQEPYLTLQNSTAENDDGECESKIIFEDHGNNALGQIEVSHVGSSDDEKGQLILSTNNDSGLQTALTINEAQNVGIGVSDPDTPLEVFDTSTQLKLSYDGSNASTFTVDATGELTIDNNSNVYTFGDSGGSQVIVVDAADDSNSDLYLNTDAHHLCIRAMGGFNQGVISLGDDCGRQLVLCDADMRGEDWEHDVQTNPTLYIHSAEDPDTDETQWLSLHHDQTDAQLEVGKGSLVLKPAIATEFYANTVAPTIPAGISGAVTSKVQSKRTIGGITELTTVLTVDLGNGSVVSSGTQYDCVAYNNSTAAYVADFQDSTYGSVFDVKLVWTEAPMISTTTIKMALVAQTDGTKTFDEGLRASGYVDISNLPGVSAQTTDAGLIYTTAGTILSGVGVSAPINMLLDGYRYLYFCNADTNAGTYTDGICKIIITGYDL